LQVPTRSAPIHHSFTPLPKGSLSCSRTGLKTENQGFRAAGGVSTTTINNWEVAKGTIRPHAMGLAGLTRLHGQA